MADELALSGNAPETNGASQPAPEAQAPQAPLAGMDLNWVWKEVRKRVFIKLPFSLGVADAMEAVIPITLDEDTFVCGLAPRDYPLSGHLHADSVRNTVEGILRQASRRHIRFELIEGTTIADWETIKERQRRAHAAVIAMAEQKLEEHHFEDVLNQIVGELRQRITSARDRMLPQIRAQLLLDIVPQLSDAEEMLFAGQESHDRRRAMARAIDRVAGFLEVPPLTLALEIERQRRETYASEKSNVEKRAREQAEADQKQANLRATATAQLDATTPEATAVEATTPAA
jgi:hypothetical protein